MRARRGAALVALLAALAGCATQPTGTTTAPPPTEAPPLDTSEERGACIGATAHYETCTYGIAVIGPPGRPRMIVSQKMVGTRPDGQPEWQELDHLDAPTVPVNGSVEFGSCRYQGAVDDTIVALLPFFDDTSPEYIAAAGWAYRIDLPSGHFAALDATAVDCVNTTIGVD
jgi:hypothetical protein